MYPNHDRFLDRNWAGVGHFLIAAVFVAAAAGLMVVTFGGGSSRGRRDGEGVAGPAVATPSVKVQTAAAGEAFRVAGASFTVVDRPRAGWARSAVAAAPAPGHRLVVAAVEVVGRGRTHFDPALLSYLVRGPGGSLYAPVKSGIVGPNSIGETRGLGRGERAEERLLFSLPESVRRPILAIRPPATRALEVRVPLAQ